MVFSKFFTKLDACDKLVTNRASQLHIINHLHGEKEEKILNNLAEEEKELRAVLIS